MDQIAGWTRDFTDQELEYQAVLEAQLKHTVKMINQMVTVHPHYTDDCGDYLFSALELSRDMMLHRMDGIHIFVKWLDDMKKLDEDDEDSISNYASDGVAPEVYEFFETTP